MERSYGFPSNFASKLLHVESTLHSMLRLDATTKKRYDGKLFKFKKFSIKQAFFINDISSYQVEVHKQFFFEVWASRAALTTGPRKIELAALAGPNGPE